MANKKSKKASQMKKAKKVVKKITQKKVEKKVKTTQLKKKASKKVKAVKKVTTKKLTSKSLKSKKSTAKKASGSKPIAPKASVKKTEMARQKITDYTKVITPLADRVVVRLTQNERVTAGGLIIPDTVSSADGFLKAEVLAVGHGAKNKKGHVRPLDVQVGQKVLFSQYAGTKVQFESEDLHIINESDVLGILE